MAATTTAEPRRGARVRVQQFGTFLSNMVLPNIGAFIAWGLITALFIEVGWITLIGDKIFDYKGGYGFVEELGGWGSGADGTGIVGPMITYLLPILIGYTGGRMAYGDDNVRGGVVGAIATMGAVTGADVPMFLGAMIMGPLGGYTMRRLDERWAGKIKPGFEMLVNNFSAGIWGMILAIGGFLVAGPFVEAFSDLAGNVVDFLVDNSLLPLTSIFVEPAKVLFLNNAINHGIFTPLGTTEAAEQGQSILFLIEANPGPGFGLLIAFSIFGKGLAKASAPGAAVIQFFGGIHEIYFPYVLMKPKTILAVVLGGMSGVAVNLIFDSGLRAPAAPGSIIAVWLQAPASSLVGVTLVGDRRGRGELHGRQHAAQDGARRGRGRPRRSDREHGVDEGQEVPRLVGPRVRAAAGTSSRSSSPATPGWAPPRWARPCCARRSRPPATET